jgi:hypothetical protein
MKGEYTEGGEDNDDSGAATTGGCFCLCLTFQRPGQEIQIGKRTLDDGRRVGSDEGG